MHEKGLLKNASRFIVVVVVYVFTTPTKISFNCTSNILLLGISPRFWSIFCIIDLGKVIPSFTVLSIVAATIVLLVILVECTMPIAKSCSIGDCIKLLLCYIM